MRTRLQRALQRWLADEAAAREGRVEASLARFLRRLPAPAPPAGFAERVLVQAGLLPAPVALAGGPALPLKVALGVCFALSALAASFVPAVVGVLKLGLRPSFLVDLGAGLVVAASERLAQALALWSALAQAGETISRTLSSPSMLAACLLAVLVSLGAFRVLHSLLVAQGSSGHARHARSI